MSATHPTVNLTKSSPKIVYLEIKGPEDKDTQIPVRVTTLSSGVVGLEAQRPWSRIEAESLRDQESHLTLWSPGRREPFTLKGRAIRFRLANFRNGISSLDFELDSCDAQTSRRLNDAIDHVTKDRKILWDHWDEIRNNSGSRFPHHHKVYLLGVILAIGGLACFLTKVDSLRFVAATLWVLSGVLGAGNALRSLQQNHRTDLAIKQRCHCPISAGSIHEKASTMSPPGSVSGGPDNKNINSVAPANVGALATIPRLVK